MPITFAGTPAACTDIAYDASRSTWVCMSVDGNAARLPVAQPAPYQGPCAELQADRSQAAWVCMRGTPRAPGELQGAPALPTPGNATS